LAIWHFSDDVELETITDETEEVRARAIEIADEAASGGCPPRRTEPPDLQVEPASITHPPQQRLEYSVVADVFDAGRTITATLTGPATFDDETQSTTFVLDTSGAVTFGVTSISEGESTLSVSLPYVLEAGIVFSELDPERPSQRLVMAQRLESVADAEAHATWFDDSTETPTKAPNTATPVPTETEVTVQTETPAPTLTPAITITPRQEVTPSATSPEEKPQDTPAPQPTPVIPEKMPKTGAGGVERFPMEVLVLLLLGGGWLVRKGAVLARRS
jgi:hypothetical protein